MYCTRCVVITRPSFLRANTIVHLRVCSCACACVSIKLQFTVPPCSGKCSRICIYSPVPSCIIIIIILVPCTTETFCFISVCPGCSYINIQSPVPSYPNIDTCSSRQNNLYNINKKSEQSCIYVVYLPLSTIFVFDFETILTALYFLFFILYKHLHVFTVLFTICFA